MDNQSQKTPAPTADRGWFRRNAVKIVIVLAAVGILTGVAAVPSRDREVPPGEAEPVNVTAIEVIATPELADTLVLPGVVEPNRVVTISAEVAARVERIPQEEGDMVRAGNLLIQLNMDFIEPQFRTAEAQYRRDQIEFGRMEALVKENATSRQDLDNATTSLAASQAALEEARARLERTRIVAPADGVLNRLLVEEGEYVQGGMAVAEVVEMDTVKVTVDVPEHDIGYFAVGGSAEVLANTKDEEHVLTGTITYIDELANAQTRTTSVEITLDNSERSLRSGQIVRARLTRRIVKDAVMIPLLAVIPMEDGYAVYVADGNVAERTIIKPGLIKGDSLRVLEGLTPGQKLIVAGHRFLAPGQQINIVSQAE